jgi:hypothetical protein
MAIPSLRSCPSTGRTCVLVTDSHESHYGNTSNHDGDGGPASCHSGDSCGGPRRRAHGCNGWVHGGPLNGCSLSGAFLVPEEARAYRRSRATNVHPNDVRRHRTKVRARRRKDGARGRNTARSSVGVRDPTWLRRGDADRRGEQEGSGNHAKEPRRSHRRHRRFCDTRTPPVGIGKLGPLSSRLARWRQVIRCPQDSTERAPPRGSRVTLSKA